MLLSPDRRRLSKRDRDLDLSQLRQRWKPEQLIGFLAWSCGLLDQWGAISLRELASGFAWDQVRKEDIVVDPAMLC